MRALVIALCGVVLFLSTSASADTEAETARLTISYVGLENDPRHAEFRGYANIVLRPAADPFKGAETALRESRVIGRALGIDLELQRSRVADAAMMVSAIKAQRARGTRLFIVDAPGDLLREVAERTKELDVLLFNVSSPDDSLRDESCQPHLLHTYPSRSMLADALVQYAVSMDWTEALVLRGSRREDKAAVDAFRRAAGRFGLDIVVVREFAQNNDPRDRSRNNVALLTRGNYDVVYVADVAAARSRYVPYQTRHPRPVIGDQGLMPAAWHWATERYGGPQLNQRFERIAQRHMNGKDWAAWAAVRIIVDGVRATRSSDFDQLAEFLLQGNLNLDTYKGSPGGFRPWNGQLRQPVVLHTENAVIGYAPFEGFLHPTHNLDTLGRDHGESGCMAGASTPMP